MKFIEKEKHPLAIWLKKEKDYYSLSKLNDYIPTLTEFELSPQDKVSVLNNVYYLIFTNLGEKPTLHRLQKGFDNYDNRMEKTYNYITQLMQIDHGKKSAFWDDRNLVHMDMIKPFSEFFDANYPEITKGKNFRKLAAEKLEELLLGVDNVGMLECVDNNKVNSLIDLFDNKFARYNAKPTWNVLIKKRPTLFFAVYANKHGYEFTSQNLKELFTSMTSSKNSYYPRGKEDEGIIIGGIFAELLANSVFFKNTIAPTKNLEMSLQKFLGIKEVENPRSFNDYLINTSIKHNVYSMKKMELDLSKHERLEIMGKSNLSKKDYEVFEEKMEAQRALKPKTKKIKL